MKAPDYTLAVFTNGEGMVSIHADVTGLGVLIATLQRLKAEVESGLCEHDHLGVGPFGDAQLSERKGCETGDLVSHVKIYGWTEEWLVKHKFK
jgi:hypothetical protein